MGLFKKIIVLCLLSCCIPDKHEKFRTLLTYLPLQDSIGLGLLDKMDIFSTKGSLRVYQVTDHDTFITAYVKPSDTGGLATLVRCDLYQDRSREIMVTALTDYGWKQPETVMNVVTDSDSIWRYSYLLDSCFFHRRGSHFDQLAELPPPDPLTWLLQVGRNITSTSRTGQTSGGTVETPGLGKGRSVPGWWYGGGLGLFNYRPKSRHYTLRMSANGQG